MVIRFPALLLAVFLALIPPSAKASSMNADRDFWSDYIGDDGTIGFWWADFPDNIENFILYRKFSENGAWEKTEEFPLECAYSPMRPCIDQLTDKQKQFGAYYKLIAVDKNRKIVKKYKELYIPPYQEQ